MLSILIIYDYCIISLYTETVLHVGQVPMLMYLLSHFNAIYGILKFQFTILVVGKIQLAFPWGKLQERMSVLAPVYGFLVDLPPTGV